VIDAVELLKQRAGTGFVGDIERDRARAAPELRLDRLQAIARSSGYDNPRAFGLRAFAVASPIPEVPPRITTVLCTNDDIEPPRLAFLNLHPADQFEDRPVQILEADHPNDGAVGALNLLERCQAFDLFRLQLFVG
jgi:hypothetical protein